MIEEDCAWSEEADAVLVNALAEEEEKTMISQVKAEVQSLKNGLQATDVRQLMGSGQGLEVNNLTNIQNLMD